MEYNEIIAQIIGQDVIKQQICESMQNKRFAIFEVIGSEGSGKKTLSKHISDDWVERFDGVVYNLNAVYDKIPEDYSTFKNLIVQNNKTKNLLLNIFCETLKDIPSVGNTLSTIFGELTKDIFASLPLDNRVLQDQFIISQIHRHANNRSILFICNNCEAWDLKSKQALSTLIQYEEENIYNKIFFIINTTHHLDGFDGDNLQINHLSTPSYAEFQELVKQFNSKIELTSEQISNLFSLTNGNLKLLKDSIGLFDKNEITFGKTYYSIIETRLNYISNNAKSLLELLKQMAFISDTVDSRLLELFVSKDEQFDYWDILTEALRISYLEKKKDMLSFVEQYIYFMLRDSYKARKYYMHLSDCLKLLYPSRYDLQMQYLYRGNLVDEADKMFFFYLIGYYRENNVEYKLSSYETERLSQNSLYSSYSKICLAYKKYKTKEYASAEDTLSGLYSSDIGFRFEIDYLRSLIVTNKYCTSGEFLERISALTAYVTDKEFKKNYPEMYLRALLILAELYAEIGYKGELKNILFSIQKCFSKYIATDKKMQCYENCFKMKANAFYKIEIATSQTKAAYNYFNSDENRQFYLNKYYLSLLNHSANEIVLGKFADAHKKLSDAYNIVKGEPCLKNIHADILINNLIISGYYCGKYSISECVEGLENIISVESADNLLLKNNQVVFLALSNNWEKALEISASLYEGIQYIDDIDPYFHYFIANNYAVLLWLTKNNTEALAVLESISDLKPLPHDQAYFNARAKFLRDIMTRANSNEILVSTNWNQYIFESHHNIVGEAWKFWSSLLLFSELQIWSDY